MIFSSGQLLLYRMTLTLGQLSWRPKNMVRLVNYRNIIMDITRTSKKRPKND
ncbi:hypothetical protein PVAP13_6NG284403 [Panicum virgatum]|uniref:Uncharacterized protein n=1 Tax=Panicum virgatum TaxID=38727 RepID=A0A8T0R1F3_PANVG|nr:hypothetical protein PVAP13_6NG284403 [Panicum virgatum]